MFNNVNAQTNQTTYRLQTGLSIQEKDVDSSVGLVTSSVVMVVGAVVVGAAVGVA